MLTSIVIPFVCMPALHVHEEATQSLARSLATAWSLVLDVLSHCCIVIFVQLPNCLTFHTSQTHQQISCHVPCAMCRAHGVHANRLLSLGGREGPGQQINGDYELVEALIRLCTTEIIIWCHSIHDHGNIWKSIHLTGILIISWVESFVFLPI